MSIKVGDKVEVINKAIFGHSISKGDVGVVKKVIEDIEIEVYFSEVADGLTQWVHYPTWNRWVAIVKE